MATNPLRNMLLRLLGKSKNVTKNVPTGPIPGSLDESFQKFVIKNNMLNQKGFFGPGGYRGGPGNFDPDKLRLNITPFDPDKLKIKENPNLGRQLNLFKDKKKGGSVGPNGIL